MSSNNNDGFKKSLIIAILNNSINKLNNLNRSLHGTDQLNQFTKNQEQIFCYIFLSAYQRLKEKSNDLATFDADNNNYKIDNIILTQNELIKLIIDSILYAMFKYKRNSVWTRDLSNNSVLVSNPALKESYHYLMSKMIIFIFDTPQLSTKLQELADDYSITTPSNNNLPYDPSLLPRPQTPDNGWPSSRRGGTRKRKYSPTKSPRGRRRGRRRKLNSSNRNKRRRVKSRST
jgi:hypothetical protein